MRAYIRFYIKLTKKWKSAIFLDDFRMILRWFLHGLWMFLGCSGGVPGNFSKNKSEKMFFWPGGAARTGRAGKQIENKIRKHFLELLARPAGPGIGSPLRVVRSESYHLAVAGGTGAATDGTGGRSMEEFRYIRPSQAARTPPRVARLSSEPSYRRDVIMVRSYP